MTLFAPLIVFFFCLQAHAQNVLAGTQRLHSFRQAVGDSRVIGLGEFGHGYKTINNAKAAVVNTLRQEMGIEATLFESSFTLSIISFLTDSMIDARASHFLYPFWNTASVKAALTPFLQNEHDKPLITGFDMQEDCRFTRFSQTLLSMNIVSENRRRLLECDSILNYYIGKKFNRKYPLSNIEYQQLSQHYQAVWKEISRKGLDTMQTKLLERCITNRMWLCKYLSIQSVKERMYYRDSLMAQNISWLHQQLYDGSKVVLWAADTHLAKATNDKQSPLWTGEWLQRIYGQGYYAVSFRKGSSSEPFLWPDTLAKYANRSNEKFELIIGVGSLIKIDPSEWVTPCD